MDINALMRQAQSMQKQMQKKQKEVEAQEFTITSNGGAITITIMGDKTVKSIDIDEDLIDKENKEMLQEMLVIAILSLLGAYSPSSVHGISAPPSMIISFVLKNSIPSRFKS